jgi:hypothetical protein
MVTHEARVVLMAERHDRGEALRHPLDLTPDGVDHLAEQTKDAGNGQPGARVLVAVGGKRRWA